MEIIPFLNLVFVSLSSEEEQWCSLVMSSTFSTKSFFFSFFFLFFLFFIFQNTLQRRQLYHLPLAKTIWKPRTSSKIKASAWLVLQKKIKH